MTGIRGQRFSVGRLLPARVTIDNWRFLFLNSTNQVLFEPPPIVNKGASMEMAEYLNKAYELFLIVEDKLEEFEEEVDYDKTDGKIEIQFENGSSPLVINTQRAIHEIWMAGGARAWHFKWEEEAQKWIARAEQEEFYNRLAQLIEERIRKSVQF